MKTFEKSMHRNGSAPVWRSVNRLKDQRKPEKLLSRVFWFSGQFQDIYRNQEKEKYPYKSFSLLGSTPPGPEVFRDSGVSYTPLTPTERQQLDPKNSRSKSCVMAGEKTSWALAVRLSN